MSTIRKLKFENNNNTFKIEDTTTTIKIYALEDNTRVIFDSSDKLEIKIKNSSGYLITIIPDVSSDNKTVSFSSAQLENLPVGYYQFELRVNNNAIFPNEGFLGFEITRNATDITGEVISSITLHDFEDKINQLADDLQARADNGDFDGKPGRPGDKGDPGTNTDPNAVHISGDQTISGVKNFIDTPTINGNKVMDDSLQIGGRNLLLGTSKDFVTYTAQNGSWGNFILSNGVLKQEIDSSSVLTISLNYKNVSYENSRWYIQIGGYDSDNKFVSNIQSDLPRFIQQSGRVSSTFTIPDRISRISSPTLCCRDKPSEAYSIDIGSVQAELGDIATDYSPATEDIGTYQPIMSGNYGLRVTSDGFKKTTDGGATWTTANI